MAREQVRVIEFSTAEPAAVWAIARDFCGLWHPVIATMVAKASKAAELRQLLEPKQAHGGQGKQ